MVAMTFVSDFSNFQSLHPRVTFNVSGQFEGDRGKTVGARVQIERQTDRRTDNPDQPIYLEIRQVNYATSYKKFYVRNVDMDLHTIYKQVHQVVLGSW